MNDDEEVVAFRRKARVGQARRRREDDDDHTGGDAIESPILRTPKAKDMVKPKPKPTSRLSFGATADDEEPTFAIKKSAASQRSSGLRQEIPMEIDDRLPVRPSYTREHLSELKSNTPTRPKSLSEDAASVETKFGNISVTDDIPNSYVADAARRRREQQRAGGTDDYIYLDSGQQPKNGESRLVREEDELGDVNEGFEDYVSDRIALGSKAEQEAVRRKRANMQEMIVDAQVDEDEEEELKEWEASHIDAGIQKQVRTNGKKTVYHSAPIPQVTPIPSLSDVQMRLISLRSDLKDSSTAHRSQLAQITKERDEIMEQENEVAADLDDSKLKYEFFQQFKTFADNLANLMEQKMPELKHHEEQQILMMQDRTEAVRLARSDAYANVNRPYTNVRDAKGQIVDYDISPTDLQDYNEARQELMVAHQYLIGDVEAEYQTCDGIINWFSKWKSSYTGDYRSAYGGLAIPSAIDFYVRYEMVSWEIFRSRVDIDKAHWHRCISNYATHDDERDEEDMANGDDDENNDDDANILGRVVTKFVIPRFVAVLQAYDPFSTTQTRNALHFVEQISYHVRPTNPIYQTLVQAMQDHLKEAAVNVTLDLIKKHQGQTNEAALTLLCCDIRALLGNIGSWARLADLQIAQTSDYKDKLTELDEGDSRAFLQYAYSILERMRT